MNAYVLIQTEAGSAPIATALRGIPGIVSADDLTGAFDAIALTRSDSGATLADRILARIATLPGVIRAIPAPLIRSFGPAATLDTTSSPEAA